MLKGYRFLEHTSDVYIEAWGRNLEEAFEEAAKAMFEVMTDISRIEPLIEKNIVVKGFDKYSLLYNWLESLLVYFDSEGLIFGDFKVNRISSCNSELVLEGKAFGEVFNLKKHEPRTEVKAVTYSQMEIIEKEDKVLVRFVLDI